MQKVAFVSGSGKNLGKSIAISLAKQGIKVAVHYNNSGIEASDTLREVRKYSEGIVVRGNLTNPLIVTKVFKKVSAELGPVEILVNLIGNFIYEPINGTSFEIFRDVIESNLYSTFLTSHAVLPAMRKRKWGRIINFGCVAADSLTVRKNTTPYYIAKSGVIMLTKVIAHDNAKFNITVNSISPGTLKTSVVKMEMPGNRFVDFPDIENAIRFLIKPESDYINGANIEVAGGWRPGFD